MSLSDETKAHIAKLVDQAPPLTQDQKDRLRVLLRPAAEKYFTDMGPMVWHQPELPETKPADPEPADAQGALMSMLKRLRGDEDGQVAEGS